MRIMGWGKGNHQLSLSLGLPSDILQRIGRLQLYPENPFYRAYKIAIRTQAYGEVGQDKIITH